MFQEVMIHQSFQPNCASKSFIFLMILKLKLFQIGTNNATLELSLKRLQDRLFKTLNLDFISIMKFQIFITKILLWSVLPLW